MMPFVNVFIIFLFEAMLHDKNAEIRNTSFMNFSIYTFILYNPTNILSLPSYPLISNLHFIPSSSIIHTQAFERLKIKVAAVMIAIMWGYSNSNT